MHNFSQNFLQHSGSGYSGIYSCQQSQQSYNESVVFLFHMVYESYYFKNNELLDNHQCFPF